MFLKTIKHIQLLDNSCEYCHVLRTNEGSTVLQFLSLIELLEITGAAEIPSKGKITVINGREKQLKPIYVLLFLALFSTVPLP